MAQKIASAGIVALKEALTSLYWYKNDLRSFLASTVTDPAILSRLNWDDYKRNIVSQLVDHMAKRIEASDQFQTSPHPKERSRPESSR